MNTELGRKVLDHVTAHRDQFDMGTWGDRDPESECGTTACLGGWALLLSGCRVDFAGRFIRPDGSEIRPGRIGEEAARLLELTAAELYGGAGDGCTLFGTHDEDEAVERFRLLVEAAEAQEAAVKAAGRQED